MINNLLILYNGEAFVELYSILETPYKEGQKLTNKDFLFFMSLSVHYKTFVIYVKKSLNLAKYIIQSHILWLF